MYCNRPDEKKRLGRAEHRLFRLTARRLTAQHRQWAGRGTAAIVLGSEDKMNRIRTQRLLK